MPGATPGPYDDAIAALGVQINALTADLKALREGHAPKSDLDALRGELSEARKELAAMKKAATPKPPKLELEPGPGSVEDDECMAGFW